MLRTLALVLGALAIGAIACSDLTGPGNRMAPLVVNAHVDTVHFVAVGATQTLTGDARRRGRVVSTSLQWFGSNDSIAAVSLTGQLVARGAGTARVYVTSSEGGLDSLVVIVAPAPARARITRARTRLVAHRTSLFAAESFDAGDAPVLSGIVTWSSSDISRVTVNAEGLVRAIAPGTARIRAEVDGFAAETTVTVVPAPRLLFSRDTIVLGVSQSLINVVLAPYLTAENATREDRAVISITIADSTVVNGGRTTAVPELAADRAYLNGLREGTTTIVASAPGWQSASAVVVVTPSRLRATDPSPVTMRLSGEVNRVRFDIVDSLGIARAVTRIGHFQIRVADTTVLKPLADSVLVEYATWVQAAVLPLAAGTTRVTVSRAGYGVDSVDVVVRPGSGMAISPPQALYGYDAVIGISGRMTTSVGHTRGQIAVSVPYHVDTIRTIRLTQRRPDVLALSDSLLLSGGFNSSPTFSTTGLALGTDTIVATSEGLGADTLIVDVIRPTVVADSLPPRIFALEARRVSLAIADNSIVYPFMSSLNAAPDRLISSDTAVLRVRPNDAFQQLSFEARAPGTATLRVESTDGTYAPLQLPPITVQPIGITMFASATNAATLDMGTRSFAELQSTSRFDEWTTSLWMRARSTNPDVVRIVGGDSAFVPGRHWLESGSAAGNAWIVIDGSGVVPESLYVTTRSTAFVVRGTRPLIVGETEPYWAWLEHVDPLGTLQYSADSLTFAVSVSDPTIAVPLSDTLRFEQWSIALGELGVRALRAGFTIMTIRDTRTGPERFPDLAIGVRVVLAPPPET